MIQFIWSLLIFHVITTRELYARMWCHVVSCGVMGCHGVSPSNHVLDKCVESVIKNGVTQRMRYSSGALGTATATKHLIVTRKH